MTHPFLSIQKVPLTFSTLGLVSLWLFGFATEKPNRLLDGVPVHLFDAADSSVALFVTGLWLLILAGSLLKTPGWTRGYLTVLTTWSLIPLYLWTAGSFASEVATRAGPLARVSLGPAAWIALFLIALLIADSWQRSNPRERLFLFCTGFAALLLLVHCTLQDNWTNSPS